MKNSNGEMMEIPWYYRRTCKKKIEKKQFCPLKFILIWKNLLKAGKIVELYGYVTVRTDEIN